MSPFAMLFTRKVKVSDTAGTAAGEAHLNCSLLFTDYMTNGKKPDLLNKTVHRL